MWQVKMQYFVKRGDYDKEEIKDLGDWEPITYIDCYLILRREVPSEEERQHVIPAIVEG